MASSDNVEIWIETDGEIGLVLDEDGGAELGLSIDGVYLGGEPPHYGGAYEFVPSANAQVIETHGLLLDEDITIDPIPSNYGLITWDGSTITVS